MSRNGLFLRIVSVVTVVVFMWTNCVWASGLNAVNADKLAATPQVEAVAQTLATHPAGTRLLAGEAVVEGLGISSIGDIVKNMQALTEAGTKCFVSRDAEGNIAKYVIEDGAILRKTKEGKTVSDKFYKQLQLLGIEGKQETIEGEVREYIYITDKNVAFINSVLALISDNNPEWVVKAVERLASEPVGPVEQAERTTGRLSYDKGLSAIGALVMVVILGVVGLLVYTFRKGIATWILSSSIGGYVFYGLIGVGILTALYFITWRYVFPVSWYIWRLKSDDSDIRCKSAEALGRIGDKSAMPALGIALKGDSDNDVRRACAEALLFILDKNPGLEGEYVSKYGANYRDVLNAYILVSKKNWDDVVRLGVNAIPALKTGLKSDNYYDVHRACAEALGRIGDKSAIPALEAALESDENMYNRRACAEALLSILDKNSGLEGEYISKYGANYRDVLNAYILVSEKNWDDVVGLGVDAIPALEVALKSDEGWGVRGACAEALGRIGDNRGIEYLIEELKSDSVSSVDSAKGALERLGYTLKDASDGLIEPRRVYVSQFREVETSPGAEGYYPATYETVKDGERQMWIGKLISGQQVREDTLKTEDRVKGLRDFAFAISDWRIEADVSGYSGKTPINIEQDRLKRQLGQRSWLWGSFPDAAKDVAVQRVGDTQGRLSQLVDELVKSGILPSIPVSVYLGGSYPWVDSPNDIDLYFIVDGEYEYSAVNAKELGQRLFGVDLDIVVLGIETARRAVSVKSPDINMMKLRTRLLYMYGATHIAGIDIYEKSHPDFKDFSILRDILLYVAELASWPDIKDDSKKVEEKKQWRHREARAIEGFFKLEPRQSQYTRSVLKSKEMQLMTIPVDYTGTVGDVRVSAKEGELAKLAGILGVDAGQVPGIVQTKLQGILKLIAKKYPGMLGAARQIALVDNLGGIDSSVRDAKGALSSFQNGVIAIDIDAFRNDIVLKDVVLREIRHSVLEIVEKNKGVEEAAAVYQSLLDFTELSAKEQAELITFLKQKDNGLQSEGYADLLKMVQEKGIKGEALIPVAIGYVLSESRYSGIREGLMEGMSEEVKKAIEKLNLAAGIYQEIMSAVQGVPAVTKVKNAVTKSRILMKIKMIASRWSVDTGFVDKLKGQGKYVQLDVNELERNPHMVDWLKRLTAEQQGAFIFSSSSETSVAGFITRHGINGIDVKDIQEKRITRNNIITLLELGALDTSQNMPENSGLYLPYIYSITGIYLAAQVILANGDFNSIEDNLVKTTLISTLGLDDPGDFNALFRGQWPKAFRVSEIINEIRNAIRQTEIAA